MTNANPKNPVFVNYHLKLNSTVMLINRMNPLLKLLDEKKWNVSDLFQHPLALLMIGI
jgi:hypothetical protein